MTSLERKELHIVRSRLDTVSRDLIAARTADVEEPELILMHVRDAEATLSVAIGELHNLLIKDAVR
jgi:hypothetical protein